MKRRVLLLEPNYRNKYPPMGLMKLAMYHRIRGDEVTFYKGAFSQFILEEVTADAIAKLQEIDDAINWQKFTPDIARFIRAGAIEEDSEFERCAGRPFVKRWLVHFREYYKTDSYYCEPRWDRVCVTTLFTFYWDVTWETIAFATRICKSREQVFVGGILASLIGDKKLKTGKGILESFEGISLHKGSLNCVSFEGDVEPLLQYKEYAAIPIDELPLDYSILDEIDYQYPAADGFYAYSTRGCVRTCSFCAVPKLEPHYREHIPLLERLKVAREKFGEQRNLLLMDNNAFASAKFDKIIAEIRDAGFAKGATFVPSNLLDVTVRLLEEGWNERACLRKIVRLLGEFVEKLEGEKYDKFRGLLLRYDLVYSWTATKENVLQVYAEIKEEYENMRAKRPVVRFVDFNQGMDARLATPEKMQKLASVAIRPLRIAFDSWVTHRYYVRAIHLAAESGISQMSNYLLYNFKDKPVELYWRLRLNVDLCDKLDVNIYSFPMKYHPITDEEWFSNRDYIGVHWTRKAIRAIQAVLGSTAGKVGRGRTFFFKAFGRSAEEFLELLQMPEAFIVKRWDAEIGGLTASWRNAYSRLDVENRSFVDSIVGKNEFAKEKWADKSDVVREVLDCYLYKPEEVPAVDEAEKKARIQAFSAECPVGHLPECGI